MARTLSIRHVPGDVTEGMERSASHADNVELLQALPSADLEAGEILEALHQSRAEP